ncbi:PUA-like domain-containing protein [Pyronema omphalodes]|nr:PUA-like domain-containing protein [Pyronema omphalodes]
MPSRKRSQADAPGPAPKRATRSGTRLKTTSAEDEDKSGPCVAEAKVTEVSKDPEEEIKAAEAVKGPKKEVQTKSKKQTKTGKVGDPGKPTTENVKDPEDAQPVTITNAQDLPTSGRRFWLMKAEPETRIEKGKDIKFSIDDLASRTEPEGWDGIRNYGARNNLRSMKCGDLAFFYHSNCKIPGIVGIMTIVKEASIDTTAFDPKEPYYDPKSDPSNPKWYLVHVKFVEKFSRIIGLHELKKYAGKELADMPLLKQGRLSVSEVPEHCWDFVMGLAKKPAEEI